ncbi:MAG: hypothetical protein HYX48_04195 [Chlamydiales bacterium]|nr:hypothetical protein [Chlamydiales bacterium]
MSIRAVSPRLFEEDREVLAQAYSTMLSPQELVVVSRVNRCFRGVVRLVFDRVASEICQTSKNQTERFSQNYNLTFEDENRPVLEVRNACKSRCIELLNRIKEQDCVDREGHWLKEHCSKFIEVSFTAEERESDLKRFAVFYNRFGSGLQECVLSDEELGVCNMFEKPKVNFDGNWRYPLRVNTADEAALRVRFHQILDKRTTAIQGVESDLTTFWQREALTLSFKQIRGGDQHLPTHQAFRVWYSEVRAVAHATSRGRVELLNLRAEGLWKKLSIDNFTRIHTIYTSNLKDADEQLSEFREAILSQNVDIPNLSGKELRAWFCDPQNEPLLAQVQALDVTCLPLEVGKLKGLTSLKFNVYHYDKELEDLLASLPHLSKLEVSNGLEVNSNRILQGFERFPALTELDWTDDKVKILPDGVARKVQINSFSQLFSSAIDQCWSLQPKTTLSNPYNKSYLGFNRTKFTQIPFFLWFRETFSLPYIWIFSYADTVKHFLTVDRIWGRFIINQPLQFAFELPLFLVALLPALALNLTIFAYNIFLDKAIEPVVTFFRDRLGYSRMVDV